MIYLNRNAPGIIARCANSITVVVPERRVGLVRRGNCIRVSSYFGGWPRLLPQHGPGKKHERAIILEAWQCGLVRAYPEQFVRGCIESDGCRHRRIVSGKNYPAYSFKNRSEDILGLFSWTCHLIEVSPRRANAETLSIARRSEVARLDTLMGYTSVEPAPELLPAVERRQGGAEEEVGDAGRLVGDVLQRPS